MDVVNVRDFGATGDGIHDDQAAIQAAASTIPVEGGILFFPVGTFLVDRSITLGSRTVVLGSGRGSVVKAVGRKVLFEANGVRDVRFSSLAMLIDLEHSAAGNFAAAINFERGTSDVGVKNCWFEAIKLPAAHLTLYAVLAKGVERLSVQNNRIHQMQIKTGSDSLDSRFHHMGPALIADNVICEPRNWAITAVHFVELAEIEDLIIRGNIIVNPAGEGGIAVGTDGDQNRIKSLRRIVVADNIIKGTWTNRGATDHKQAIGILVRAARESEQIRVSGNAIGKDGADDVQIIGIKINPVENSVMRSLSVTNNHIENSELWAIQVLADKELSQFTVSDNILRNTGGIQLRRGLIADGSICNNNVHGRGTLHLQTVFPHRDRIGPILIRDNIFKNGSVNGITLEASEEETLISADVVANLCSDDRVGLAKTQRHGIQEIGDPKHFDTVYIHNDVRGNIAAGLEIMNTRAMVRNNRGWTTENKGHSKVIPTGSTSSGPIAHGLSVMPRPSDLTIIPTNQPQYDPGHIWVDGISRTEFTVHCANDPGDPPLKFEWRAVVL